jgi:TetR/AcrR family transcriptional regulator, regulator of autoinduction and epiphytic fitness
VPLNKAASDGRTARAERTRTAVVDALLDLIEGGDLQPPAQAVAERAGVSLRIVYHHFADLARLFAAAAARHSERVLSDIVPLANDGPFARRADAFVQQRTRLYERIFNMRRAGRLLEHSTPFVGDTLRLVRAYKREVAAQLFAQELERLPPSLRRERTAALGAVTSFNTWEALRAHQELSIEEARRVWRGMIAAVLKED